MATERKLAKQSRLGRGLDSMLKDSTALRQPAPGENLRALPIEQIEPGSAQPRRNIEQDSLKELADSIRAQGVVQPIVVRPVAKNRYEIVAGERRWRAAQLARRDTIPAVVRHVSDEAAVAIALIENIQREDLNPLEEATALARLIEEFSMTHQEAAEAVGRSRAAVSNLLRLLDLSAPVKALVDEGKLDMGHARALLSLKPGPQLAAARQVVSRDLSVRQTEALVKRLQETPAERAAAKTRRLDPDLRRLQDALTERLGAKVRIRPVSGGGGRVVIRYSSLDELDGILQRMGRTEDD